MTRRALITFIFFIAGLRLVISYTPQSAIADAVGPTQDPTATPGTSDSPVPPSATPTSAPTNSPANASATPAPTVNPHSSATPQPTATAKPTPTPKPTAAPVATVHSGTYTGSNYNYRYGNMQVTVKITNGKVTSASTVQTGSYAIGFNSGGCTEAVFNSAAINLAADSTAYANFVGRQPQACSNATFSWKGYGHSLQAAIDKATY
jgi:uncharacterized protein with FMN-binding domain